MNPDLPAVDVALADLERLLVASGVGFKLVGGLAVVHHGYSRTTEDIDVLVEATGPTRLEPKLAAFGFERSGKQGLRHLATGVRVDLLIAGTPMPRTGSGTYPSPDELPASPRDQAVVGLPGLLELKLRSARHRDKADVVELLKRLDEGHYIEVEAAIARELRPALAALRRDAIEELTE